MTIDSKMAERLEQNLGFLQIPGVEALREPTVSRREKTSRFGVPSLVAP